MNLSHGPFSTVFIPPSPCEVWNCKMFEECKKQCLSCSSFAHYIATGHSDVEPMKKRYRITGMVESRKYHKKEPNRELYNKIFKQNEELQND